MRKEADGRAVTGPDRGKRREDVAVLGQLDVPEPEAAQLVREETREVELLQRAREGVRDTCRLRVDPCVADETLEHVVGELRGDLGSVGRSHAASLDAGRAR